MTTPAIITPRARTDLLEAMRWIAKDSRAAAQGLRRSIAIAADTIADHPNIGRQRPELAGVHIRFLVLSGFPYLVVYRANSRPPRILRILHGARDLPELLRDL